MNSGIFVIGLIALLLGFIAYGYTVTSTDTYFFGAVKDSSAKQPYKDFAAPLMILGIALMIVGAAIPSVTTTTKKSEIVVPERRTKTVTVSED